VTRMMIGIATIVKASFRNGAARTGAVSLDQHTASIDSVYILGAVLGAERLRRAGKSRELSRRCFHLMKWRICVTPI